MLLLLLIKLFLIGDLTVKSPAFADKNYIPLKYTCVADNISPPLLVESIPQNTKSLALIVVDTSSFGEFDHWVMWNIPPEGKIDENTAPGKQGWNSRKENYYTGPCPPNGVHEYRFRMYALDVILDLPNNTSKKDLEKAMRSHILAQGELIGLFQK
jgi:Raf kinase inhibitor-like YbhB/YbcL family protein